MSDPDQQPFFRCSCGWSGYESELTGGDRCPNPGCRSKYGLSEENPPGLDPPSMPYNAEERLRRGFTMIPNIYILDELSAKPVKLRTFALLAVLLMRVRPGETSVICPQRDLADALGISR